LEEEGLWDIVEVYGRILLEEKPQICCRYGPGRQKQGTEKVGGRRMGRPFSSSTIFHCSSC